MVKKTSTDIWMPMFLEETLAESFGLTAEEFGGLIRLKMHYWQNKKCIKNDIKFLKRITQLSGGKLEALLKRFFVEKDGYLHNEKLDSELKKANDNSKKASDRASKRWDATASKKDMPESMLQHIPELCQNDAHLPPTSNTLQVPKEPDRVCISRKDDRLGENPDLKNILTKFYAAMDSATQPPSPLGGLGAGGESVAKVGGVA